MTRSAIVDYEAPRAPALAGELACDGDQVRIVADGVIHEVSGSAESESLATMVACLDGTDRGVAPGGDVDELIYALDQAGLIDDRAAAPGRRGIDVILDIEDRIDALCRDTLFVNPFWETCLSATEPGDVPEKLATGMVIENWHFLFRESYFDAPVLSYVANTKARLLLNQFFSEEYGHDDILLKSLEFVGLTREDMHDAIPLPETMALCNALAYWAHNDPLFFFTTLGLLEGQGMKHDSFIEACTRCGFDERFVKPLRTHADINLGAAHGNLTRQIFQEIPIVSPEDEARLKRQIPLFVELYDDFYRGVWRYYTSDAPLLRRVSEA